MLVEVTEGEQLWERLAASYPSLDSERELVRFRTAVVDGLRELQRSTSHEIDALGSVFSPPHMLRKSIERVKNYRSFFSSAERNLEDRGLGLPQVFPNLPDLEQILQKEVHPPQLLPTITQYIPAVGAIAGAVAGTVWGGYLFDYLFDHQTVAYLGSGLGTVVGGISGGFLAHVARLPLARYLSAVDKQQTRHAYDVFLEQMEGWMSHYRPPDESM